MAQSFNIQGMPALDKENIIKFGPVAGAAVSVFGLFLFFIGLLFDWVKIKNGGPGYSGFKIFTDNSAAGFRGGFLNGFLCDLPILLCGTLIVAILIVVGAFWKKMPSMSNMIAPGALGILTLLSCCPGILFVIDVQSRSIKDVVDMRAGYFISLFGLAVTFFGGLVALGVTLYGGGFPKLIRR